MNINTTLYNILVEAIYLYKKNGRNKCFTPQDGIWHLHARFHKKLTYSDMIHMAKVMSEYKDKDVILIYDETPSEETPWCFFVQYKKEN